MATESVATSCPECGKKIHAKGLCQSHYSATYYVENRERIRTQHADYSRRSGIHRKVHLRKRGLTVEEYEAMLESQGGGCAICGSDDSKANRTADGDRGAFTVDHDHETGKIRGLLCSPCNTGIGNLGDDISRLVSAALYLMRGANRGH